MKIYCCSTLNMIIFFFLVLLADVTSFRIRSAPFKTKNLTSFPRFQTFLFSSTTPEAFLENIDQRNSVYDDLRTSLRGTCIYLVGMMGSGKSTVGDLLAKKVLSYCHSDQEMCGCQLIIILIYSVRRI